MRKQRLYYKTIRKIAGVKKFVKANKNCYSFPDWYKYLDTLVYNMQLADQAKRMLIKGFYPSNNRKYNTTKLIFPQIQVTEPTEIDFNKMLKSTEQMILQAFKIPIEKYNKLNNTNYEIQLKNGN